MLNPHAADLRSCPVQLYYDETMDDARIKPISEKPTRSPLARPSTPLDAPVSWPRSALLFGREHQTLGALAAIGEGAVAITLSRGGFAKQYEHTESNEDASCFAYGPRGAFVAVADGHHGASGAQTAIQFLANEWAPRWLVRSESQNPDQWIKESRQALADVNQAVLAEAAQRDYPPAPTTLAFAVFSEASNQIAWAGIGDSHIFASSTEETQDWLGKALSEKRRRFLGYEKLTLESLAEHSGSGICPSTSLRAIVLATDGLSEPQIGVADPAAAITESVEQSRSVPWDRRALELARQVSGVAMRAHQQQKAGDNIATAALWLEHES